MYMHTNVYIVLCICTQTFQPFLSRFRCETTYETFVCIYIVQYLLYVVSRSCHVSDVRPHITCVEDTKLSTNKQHSLSLVSDVRPHITFHDVNAYDDMTHASNVSGRC